MNPFFCGFGGGKQSIYVLPRPRHGVGCYLLSLRHECVYYIELEYDSLAYSNLAMGGPVQGERSFKSHAYTSQADRLITSEPKG
jgi:hypothetical protein